MKKIIDERGLGVIDFNVIHYIFNIKNLDLKKKDLISLYSSILYLSQNGVLKITGKEILTNLEIGRDSFQNCINFLIENRIIYGQKLNSTKSKILGDLEFKIINFGKNIDIYNQKVEKKPILLKILSEDEIDKLEFQKGSILPIFSKKILKLNLKCNFEEKDIRNFGDYLNDKVIKEKIDKTKLISLVEDWLEYHKIKQDLIKNISLSLNTWINNNLKKGF